VINRFIYDKSVNATSVTILILILALVIIAGSGIFSFHLANGQPDAANGSTLPVILIHGYFEDGSVWQRWEQLLNANNITYTIVTFGPPFYDECGSAADHANQLNAIVQEVKEITGKNQVNIVSHSKGGLDARLYLANSGTPDVANLIMIGTPNKGSPLADIASFDPCVPAIHDLKTTAPAIRAPKNPNTDYHTIAGNWNPTKTCSFHALNIPGYNFLIFWGLPNDGIVPINSVESDFNSLGRTSHCHQDLLGEEEYKLALPILLRQ
jgi:triacylglycerol esterase/lipase EstA (alpha/beta hydrolase family)